MTRSPTKLFIASLLIATAGASSSMAFAQDSQASITKELTQIEDTLCIATLKNDVGASAKYLTEDYLEIDGKGAIGTKQSSLDFVKTVKASVCENLINSVRIHGDTAIVVGKTTFKSATYAGELMFTDVFVKKNNSWMIVSNHWSEIKAPKK